MRAVSLVESVHGSGSGTSAAKDPMQCGNPADAWWLELTDQSTMQDRFIRAKGLTPNADAKQLPALVYKEATFPANAKLTGLNDWLDGHDDAKFDSTISFYWAIPILIHKTNNITGSKTYQCADSSEARLIAGAVKYNGGGTSNYKKKIEEALAIIDAAALLPAAETRAAVPAALADTLQAFVRTLNESASPILFPHGINDIDFELEISNVKVTFKVKGPGSASAAAAGPAEEGA